jgi:poly(A) polymerase
MKKTFKTIFGENSTYLVGGAIRDFLIKRPIKDLDFIVDLKKKELEKAIAELSNKLKLPYFPLDKERGIWRISYGDLNIDISVIEKNLYADLNSRDFTINSLAVKLKDLAYIKVESDSFKINLNKKNIIDANKGLADLKKKIIRANNKLVFAQDPIRILRAYRFAATLNFKIENNTLKEIKKDATLINKSAGERIKDELLKILYAEESAKYIKALKEANILFEIFPDLKYQEKCAEVYYGKGGVLKHTFLVLERMDLFFRMPEKFIPSFKKFKIKEEEIKILKLSAILHDIAKPHTAKPINGRLRFFGHEEYGAKITYNIMKNLKFSNKEIKLATKIISQHLRIGNISHCEITKKAIFKIFSDIAEFTPHLIILSFCDNASYISEKKLLASIKEIKKKPFKIKKKLPRTGFIKTLRFLQVLNYISRQYVSPKNTMPNPLLNGNEIMETLGIKPGPKVGEIISRLKLMQFQNKIETKKQAINYIKTLKIGL